VPVASSSARAALAAVALLAALLAPAPALGRGGSDDEVRVRGACGRGASSELRVKGDDGRLEVDFRVRSRRAGERWRLLLVHERRVAWRGTLRTGSSSRSVRVRLRGPDYEGADRIVARASGPNGVTCQATAVLPAS
jgi:hypothetical protein